jgi:hypothetical protein
VRSHPRLRRLHERRSVWTPPTAPRRTRSATRSRGNACNMQSIRIARQRLRSASGPGSALSASPARTAEARLRSAIPRSSVAARAVAAMRCAPRPSRAAMSRRARAFNAAPEPIARRRCLIAETRSRACVHDQESVHGKSELRGRSLQIGLVENQTRRPRFRLSLQQLVARLAGVATTVTSRGHERAGNAGIFGAVRMAKNLLSHRP